MQSKLFRAALPRSRIQPPCYKSNRARETRQLGPNRLARGGNPLHNRDRSLRIPFSVLYAVRFVREVR